MNPASTQSTVTTVTGIGTNENMDKLQVTNIVANKSVTVNGANVKTPIGKLQVQLLQRHHYAVYLHYVTEVPANTFPNPSVDPNFLCQNLPLKPGKMPMTQAQYDNWVQRLETGLNNLWTQQANVQFDVYPVQGSRNNGTGTCAGEVVPEQVHYDLNNDGNLLIDPNLNPEEHKILDAIPGANPPPMPAGVTRQFHIYFVNSFLIPLRVRDWNLPHVGPQVGIPYAITFSFDGGVAPYQYAFNANNLPPGLAFSNPTPTSVRLGGIPTPDGVGGGPYGGTLTVSDSSQPNAETITINFDFQQIVAPPGVSPMVHVDIPPQNINPWAGFTLAFDTSLGGTTILVDDRTPDARLVKVLAHELGHGLYMDHPQEDPHENWGHQQPPPNNTCIPNLPPTDSDYSDPNQLMWWADIPPKKQTHIGIQQLWQMNGNIGTACP